MPRTADATPAAVSTENSTPRAALTALALATLLSSLGTSIANVALPTLAQAFHASFPQVQWIVLAYLLAITSLILTAGRLDNLADRRILLLMGIVLFTAASVLCGAASTLWILIAARALQGMGAALLLVHTMAFVHDLVPKGQTGTAMGLLGSMSAIGTSLGPSVGGVLIAGFGWRSIFLVNLPLGLLALFLAYRYLPAESHRPRKPAGIDYAGTILLTVTLSAYALGMTLGRGHFGLRNAVLIVIAVVSAVLLARTQITARAPLIEPALFHDPTRVANLGLSGLVSTVLMATLVVGPFYLTRTLGLDAARVGLVMSIGPLVAALTGIPAGRLVDRFGAPRMTIGGLTGIAAGALLLCLLPGTFGIAGYIAPIAILTGSYALFQTANNTGVMTGSDSRQRGLISGMLNLSRNLGLITGTAVMGAVFTRAAGTVDLTTAEAAAVDTGMRITFAFATVLILVAIAWYRIANASPAPKALAATLQTAWRSQ